MLKTAHKHFKAAPRLKGKIQSKVNRWEIAAEKWKVVFFFFMEIPDLRT